MRLLALAARNLDRSRRRTALTLVALTLGVAASLGYRGLFNGIQQVNSNMVVYGELGALQVHRTGYRSSMEGLPLGLDMADTEELRERIRSVPGVKALSPRIAFGAAISTPDEPAAAGDPNSLRAGKTSYFTATAIDPALERAVCPTRFDWVIAGRAPASDRSPDLVLDTEFADALEIALPASGAPPLPIERQLALLASDREGSLNGENVVLVGKISSGLPGDHHVGLVSLGVAQRLLRMEGRVTEYAIAVHDVKSAREVRGALERALGPEFEVHSYDQLVPFLEEVHQNQDVMIEFMGAILLGMVLLGIVNTLVMSVLERTREIGALLAMGMRRRQIQALFVCEGLVLGLVGAGLGALLGALIVFQMDASGLRLAAPGSSFAPEIHPFVSHGNIATTVGMAVVGAGLAALWAARRVARLRPVEALQQP